MMENEVKIYDSSINLHPLKVEKSNAVMNSPFEMVEITSPFEEVKEKCVIRFAKKRKFRRVKSAGIF